MGIRHCDGDSMTAGIAAGIARGYDTTDAIASARLRERSMSHAADLPVETGRRSNGLPPTSSCDRHSPRPRRMRQNPCPSRHLTNSRRRLDPIVTAARALVTNDDGIAPEGLRWLAEAALETGLEVVVAAPLHDSSGTSASLTAVEADGRIVVEEASIPGFDGTPA
jgi:Survival protein SurE